LQQNSPFLLHFPVFAQLFVSHAPVCGGAWRLGGRLMGGMAGLRRDGYTFVVFAAAGAGLVDCTPANGTPFSLYNGVRVYCRYAIRFLSPLPRP